MENENKQKTKEELRAEMVEIITNSRSFAKKLHKVVFNKSQFRVHEIVNKTKLNTDQALEYLEQLQEIGIVKQFFKDYRWFTIDTDPLSMIFNLKSREKKLKAQLEELALVINILVVDFEGINKEKRENWKKESNLIEEIQQNFFQRLFKKLIFWK